MDDEAWVALAGYRDQLIGMLAWLVASTGCEVDPLATSGCIAAVATLQCGALAGGVSIQPE